MSQTQIYRTFLITLITPLRYLENIAPLSNGEYQVYQVRSSSHYPLQALVAILGASIVSYLLI